MIFVNKEEKHEQKDLKTENSNYEKTGNIIMNKKDLLDIQKLTEYCKKNKDFADKFELLEIVGSGSESIVCSFYFKKRRNRKLISKIIFNKKKQKINKSELEISKKLKHKNIISFYFHSHLIKDESWYMSMEYAKFGNLNNFRRNVLKKINLSESIICYIASQILEGLLYCHKSKIAHMDLKPNNIVVNDFLNFKIIDFSISINYQGKKLSEKIKLPFLGTCFYMPLEVIFSQKIKYKDLHKIDLYAFGIILYNLAFGCYPYNLTYDDEEKYPKIYQKLLFNDRGVNIENIRFSSHFLNFLNKLLEKDISKRINIIDAKAHYWMKGAKILLDEKEKVYDTKIFINYLVADHLKYFNDYICK